MAMDPPRRDSDLKLLPTENQIKVLLTNGGSVREEKYIHAGRTVGHFIFEQVKVILCYM
jgi:hypothetical protein